MPTTIDIDNLVDRHFNHIYARDLKSERFADLPDAEKAALTESGKAGSRKTIEGLIADIESRNIDRLSRSLHKHNTFYLGVFREVTGINLGRTDKAIVANLREYCGAEGWDRFFAAKAAKRESDAAARQIESAQKQRDASLSMGYRWPADPSLAGGVVEERRGTVKDFIHWAIDSGYVPLETKRGFASTVTLSRPLADGQWSAGYVLTHKIHAEYARERYAQEVLARPAANR